MIQTRKLKIASAAAVVLSALAITACGSSGSSHTTQATTGSGGGAPAPSTGSSSATVDLGRTSLGPILVDSRGRTLYLFRADSGTNSACSGACAAAWPPLVTPGKLTAGTGVKQSLLGTTKRGNGAEQVTYGGHPLYLFTGDTAAGQTNGQGSGAFGAPWYVLSPTGQQITG